LPGLSESGLPYQLWSNEKEENRRRRRNGERKGKKISIKGQ
jgi:hypothetical protein